MADWLSVRGCVANPLVSLFFHPNTKVTNLRIKSASRAGGTRLQRIILARGCGVGGRRRGVKARVRLSSGLEYRAGDPPV